MKISKLQEAFLKANYKKFGNRELTELYNKTFGTNKKVTTIAWYKQQLNLKKCEPGHGSDKEIGTEYKKGDFILIKVSSNPSVWMYKHRYIYEQAYGEIPKNHEVIFLDGNKQNFSLDNLALVDRKVAMLMKSQKLFGSSKEATETGILLAKLQRKSTDLMMTEVATRTPAEELRRIRSLEHYHRNKEAINAKRRIIRKSSSYRETAKNYQRNYRHKKRLEKAEKTL